MTPIFKVLSALLTYPTQELQEAAGAMKSAVAAEALPADIVRGLDRLIGEIGDGDLYDLQERYVLLFDRTRSLSLHLFEHVHGESRDRGQAMVDLQNLYAQHGLVVRPGELPDFLPMFLEFLATLPPAQGSELLAQPAHIIAVLSERLRKRHSSYEAVFRALTALTKTAPMREASELHDEEDTDPDDFSALDAAWEDEPVNFGPDALSGCKDSLVARIRAGNRPAPGITPKPPTRPILPRT
jgi:nitrate reductase delta subunit